MKNFHITSPIQETTSSSSEYSSSGREGLINQLCDHLNSRFGISPNQQMASKLNRIFIDMELVEIHRRVIELTSLSTNHPSWLELVAKLTVHETYFFRDEPQLGMLRDNLLPTLIDQAAGKASPLLRILSAGCSSGEEVYSIAMLVLDAMLEAGYAYGNELSGVSLMPGWQLEILGVDVSADALQLARNACYTKEGLGSFRNMSLQWQRWFDDIDSTSNESSQIYRRPKDFIRRITRFEQHNLLQTGIRFGLFDLVLCRNTMIYFNDKNKRIAQNHLFDVLNASGIVLLGATDPLLCPDRCERYRSRGVAYYSQNRSNLSGVTTKTA